ncbi:class I SAM-dependent methyltransferase [Candidatus Pacearchaeota archaeon]|nr:class I SAM-dependent methyltransferase [Candidatus Pacearchaeota archaeon]
MKNHRFDCRNREEADAVERAKNLLASPDEESQLRGWRILDSFGLTANHAFDRIHQQKTHGYSTKSIAVPNHFATRFATRSKMGKESKVVDIGCGKGRDSIIFAHTGATVYALDPSNHALRHFEKDLECYQETLTGDIELIRGTVLSFLDSYEAQDKKITHFYGYSFLHFLPPPLIRQTLKRIHDLASAQRGFIGFAIKTIESASAQQNHQLRLAEGDGFNPSLSYKDRIFRVFPDEETITNLIAETKFQIMDIITEGIYGYDNASDVELFRSVIARAK